MSSLVRGVERIANVLSYQIHKSKTNVLAIGKMRRATNGMGCPVFWQKLGNTNGHKQYFKVDLWSIL